MTAVTSVGVIRGEVSLTAYETSKCGEGIRKRRRLMVHASNVNGYGARAVVISLLDSLAAMGMLKGAGVAVSPELAEKAIDWRSCGVEVWVRNRLLHNSVFRFCECMFEGRKTKGFSDFLVLGDVPLRVAGKQTVLVHQSNLVQPCANSFSAGDTRYRILRWVFRQNVEYASNFVVQTEVMRQQLTASYPELDGRVILVPHPAPYWLTSLGASLPLDRGRTLRLFYPAAGFSYKNHVLLGTMDRHPQAVQNVQITTTLTPTELGIMPIRPSWVRNVGKLEPSECLKMYRLSDALFFPSFLESYGLPLVEAMALGLPVVCSALPYAQWLCEDQAIYFDPLSAESAWRGIRELRRRLEGRWRPDWTHALSKLAKSWEEVARRFLDVMGLRGEGGAEAGAM